MVQLTSGQQSEAFNLIEPDHRLLLMGKQTVFRLCPCARVLMHLSLVRNSGLLFCYMYFELEVLRLCIIGRKINGTVFVFAVIGARWAHVGNYKRNQQPVLLSLGLSQYT